MSPDAPVPHKVCPECGSQFQTWVERCVDCEVPLITPEEAAARAANAQVEDDDGWDDDEDEAGGQELVLLRAEKVTWIRRLASSLTSAGIPFHIEPGKPGGEPSLALYVDPEDLEAAQRIDMAIYRREVLGEDGPGEDLPAVPGRAARAARSERSERPAVDSATKVCPSCGGEYQAWAQSCADCGVPLVAAGAEPAWDDDEADKWDETGEARDDAARPGVSGGPESHCPACGAALPPNPGDCPECGLGLGPIGPMDEP
ncbi:MAG TPA: zinc ribbon domain-containing protein [Thermoanaerobaculia bacterium]|nr:zinc ribbon domain-containing protein [Thermoanaerobaculia bacterium]